MITYVGTMDEIVSYIETLKMKYVSLGEVIKNEKTSELKKRTDL